LKSRCRINEGSKKLGDFVANECWYNRCSYNYIWYLQPKITYGAEVWYIPPHIPPGKTKRTGSLTVLHELQKIQRIAVLAIARAMRSTPSDTLHVQVGILPMELTLKKLCQRSVPRLSSLPNTNPAAYLVQDAQRCPDKYRTFATSIHIHHCLFSINPYKVEKISPIAPRRNRNVKVEITRDQYKAVDIEDTDLLEWRVYTDGLKKNNILRAAAVLYKGRSKDPIQTLRFKIGKVGDLMRGTHKW